jgi:hypothetical protein
VARFLSGSARSAAIRSALADIVATLGGILAVYGNGTDAKGTLRTAVAAALAGTDGFPAKLSPASLAGIVDPAADRLYGLATPLTRANGDLLPATASKRDLAAAVARRRDSGVRWRILSASVEATTGRRTSDAATDALYTYARGEEKREASYVGRGTRVSAPATYGDATAEVPSA